MHNDQIKQLNEWHKFSRRQSGIQHNIIVKERERERESLRLNFAIALQLVISLSRARTSRIMSIWSNSNGKLYYTTYISISTGTQMHSSIRPIAFPRVHLSLNFLELNYRMGHADTCTCVLNVYYWDTRLKFLRYVITLFYALGWIFIYFHYLTITFIVCIFNSIDLAFGMICLIEAHF